MLTIYWLILIYFWTLNNKTSLAWIFLLLTSWTVSGMCKGFINLCCENFVFIHSSIKQHHLVLYWREHLFLTIFKEKRNSIYWHCSVTVWILRVGMMCQILICFITKSLMIRLVLSLTEGTVWILFNFTLPSLF